MKKPIIYIGVGHGGKDPGAVANGLQEKNVNLVMGMGIYDSLTEAGIECYLSREHDKDMTIPEKLSDAKKKKCNVILDVHNNAGGGDGMEILHSIFTEGEGDELANYIVRDIKNANLQNVRKVYSKANAKRPNEDYFGMIRGAHEMGAIGLILEGFFLDNVKDIKEFDTLHEQR
jgi:N-acetylmuramoyl-L-alanine amidase